METEVLPTTFGDVLLQQRPCLAPGVLSGMMYVSDLFSNNRLFSEPTHPVIIRPLKPGDNVPFHETPNNWFM